jgi:hypothetical protein
MDLLGDTCATIVERFLLPLFEDLGKYKNRSASILHFGNLRSG